MIVNNSLKMKNDIEYVTKNVSKVTKLLNPYETYIESLAVYLKELELNYDTIPIVVLCED